MILFGFVIRPASEIKKKLKDGGLFWRRAQPEIFGYLSGIYSCRIFGMCIYRLNQTLEKVIDQ